jgi:hypothetical protein
MANNYALRFTSLDRIAQKAAFIDFLKNTSEFQDFNYEASGMATLVDMLSYNAYHTALSANMLLNETFLDTATKRQNVVSRANELGYVPYSSRASKASLNVTVTNVQGNPTTLVLPSGSTFSTTVGNQSYNFVTLVPYSATISFDVHNLPFYLFTIDVYEGLLAQNSVVISADPSIDLNNIAIDTTTLRVFVTLDTTEYEFYQPGNFLTIETTNKVFFLTERFNGYSVTFGDNTFGYQPPTGSAIRCQYLLTSGAGANDASLFSFSSIIPGATSSTVVVTTTSVSQGGGDRESIDSIKVNAVNYFTTQDRAVTANDYKSLIIQSSTNVKDVLTWGGEANNPPIFGKVVACVQPKYGDTLTITDKDNIKALVAAKAVPNVGIAFVDPIYLNLVVNSLVTYDSKVITSSVYDLQALIQTTIANFITSNLSKFNGRLRISNLFSTIDRTDSSVLSNITSIQLKYKYKPTLYQTTSVSFSFNNQLDTTNKNYVMKSSLFYISGFTSGVWVEDDGQGVLNVFYSKNGVKTYAKYNAGTINYGTGAVYMSGILITGVDGVTIDFIATPTSNDLQSINQTIINVDSSDITISTQVNN